MTTMNPSNEFSSESEFSFDLKFGQDNEDLMSGGSDLFTATQTRADPLLLSDDFVHHSAQDDMKTRKRKLDNEGFVTPATPDIPKTSMQYSMSDQGDFTEPEQNHREDLNTEGPDDFIFTWKQEQHQAQHQKKHKHHNQCNEVTSKECNMNNASSSHEPMTKTYTSVVDVFEDLAQGTEMLLMQKAQNFREGEEYESACLDKVKSLMIQAKDLEERLSNQKENLQKRLFMIGQRFSTQDQ